MQTYQINVARGRERVHEIREELFAFPEVVDVFVTGGPDALVVVYCGRPRPAEWLRTLRAVGYETLARRHATTQMPAPGAEPRRRPSPTSWPPLPGPCRRRPWSPALIDAERADVIDHRSGLFERSVRHAPS
jgi:hypothetical protein